MKIRNRALFVFIWMFLAACNEQDFATDNKKHAKDPNAAADDKDPYGNPNDDIDLEPGYAEGDPNESLTPGEIFDEFFNPPDTTNDLGSSTSVNSNSQVDLAGGLLVLGGDGSQAKSPRFGLLVNDPRCGLCHFEINGDIASIKTVPPLFDNSAAKVNGSWFIHGEQNGRQGTNVTIQVTGAEKTNHKGKELPNDLDKDGHPDFPQWTASNISGKMTGKVKSKNKTFERVHDGDLVLIGTDADPIMFTGEILVRGDLVIKGIYTGIATFYVTGNIYIPGDLKGKKNPFPFGSSPNEEAKQANLARMDALALASKKTIVVGDFEGRGVAGTSMFDHPETPAELGFDALKLRDLYSWYPGGKTGYEALFEDSPLDCQSPSGQQQSMEGRGVSRIDAFLHAETAIGGRSSRNSIAINGGIITDHFHIISGAMYCSSLTHPVHELPANKNYVNYDYRLLHGLNLLMQMKNYFMY